VTTYTIGEVAERSGFTASALRYYEGIGLVEPADRTPAGYRLYDNGTLSRLTFISRAKQLGCSLDEITDLVGIWDGQRCGPVQKRFHELVTSKLAETEGQIAELTSLSRQLRQVAAQLAGPAVDGPCNEGCACLALEGAPLTGSLEADRRSIPIDDDTQPIKCTIDGSEVAERVELLDRMRRNHRVIERTEHGMLLRFPSRPDVEEDVRRFAVDEKRCCAFWGFAVQVTPDEVTLQWDAPPSAGSLVDQFLAYFAGERPLSEITGLL
jgi:MerR family transcriptional regulator, copper efflux regulator